MSQIYEKLITENENGNEYGYFPIGKTNKWHSGIHLYSKNIKPLLNGKIVAYRHNKDYIGITKKEVITSKEYNNLDKDNKECYFVEPNAEGNHELKDKQFKDYLSPNFYLIKHSVIEDKLVFYTLYSHMQPEEVLLKKYINYSSDLAVLESINFPFTKKLKFKFVKSKSSNTNLTKAMPGSWFEADLNLKLAQYLKDEKELSVSPKYNNGNSSKILNYNEIEIKTLKLESNELSLFQKDLVFSENKSKSCIGTYKFEQEIKRNNVSKITVSLNGKNITKVDDEYKTRKLLLPISCLSKKIGEKDNKYILTYSKNNENRFILKTGETIDAESCPLSFTEYNYHGYYGGKNCIINNEIIILDKKDLVKVLQTNINAKKTEIYLEFNGKLISNFYYLSKEDYFNKKMEEYQKAKDLLPELPSNIMINEKTKLIKFDAEPKFILTSQFEYEYAFVYLSTAKEIKSNVKIFLDGVEITPLKLPISLSESLKKIEKEFNKNKSEIKNINLSNVKVFITKPESVYKDDSYQELEQNYADKQIKKIKEKGNYILCNHYIDEKKDITYEINPDEIKVKSILGRVKQNPSYSNLILYNNLSDSDSYGSKDPQKEITSDFEFIYESLPQKKGNNYIFTGLEYEGKNYCAEISETNLQFKIIDTGIIKKDGEIYFLNDKNEIEVNCNTILGYPEMGKKQEYYDVSLFLKSNFMTKDDSSIKNIYYLYKTIEKGKTLYINEIESNTIYLPEHSKIKVLEKSKVNERIAYKLKIEKILVFFLESQDLNKVLTSVNFKSMPVKYYLNNTEVKSSNKLTAYCFNVFESLYNKYKIEGLNIYGQDKINKQFYIVYFTSQELNLTNDFWLPYQEMYDISKLNSEIKLVKDIFLYPNQDFMSSKDLRILISENSVIKIIEADNDKQIYKVKLEKIAIWIHENFLEKKYEKYQIKANTNVKTVYLNNNSVTSLSNNKNKKFAEGFYNEKNMVLMKKEYFEFGETGTPKEYTGIYIPADKISMDFDMWVQSDLIENKENFEEEIQLNKEIKLKKDLDINYTEKNPLFLYGKEYVLDNESQISKINDKLVLQDTQKKKYYKIDIQGLDKDLYIVENEADNYRDDATDFKKFFTILNEDKESKVKLKDVVEQLDLSEEENTLTITNVDSLYMDKDRLKQSVISKLRNLNVTHMHEFDAKVYDTLDDTKDKYNKEYLKRACEAIGIWDQTKDSGGFSSSELKNVECKNNLLTFVHPAYFLNHLDTAGMLEFNPYEKYGVTPPFEMKNNPGFMPLNIDSSSFTQEFNCQSGTYFHEGVDIRVDWTKGRDGTNGIISGIMGQVIYEDDHDDYNYGNFIVIKATNGYNNLNRYFLLGHLNRNVQHLHKGDYVNPGDIVGYVGNTGHCKTGNDSHDLTPSERSEGRGSHLHLQLYLNDWNEKDFPKREYSNLIEKKYAYPRDKGVINPFDYSETYKGDMKK